ncbi:MAG: DUF934 domain-containing protein [Hyphomicrobium sp.]
MAEPTPLLLPLKPATVGAHLWTHNQFVADGWRAIADDAPLPDGGRPLLSLGRWRKEREALARRGARIGLVVQAGEALDPATDDVAGLAVIALVFPKFTDGRAYSTARRLREHWGFQGELRATGDVLLDQLPLMLRAGFDAFEIVDAATVRALARGHLPAVTRVYQPATEAAARNWRPRRPVVAGEARAVRVEAAE